MNYLKQLRIEREMTQIEVGKEAKIPQSTISQLERGLTPTPKQLKKILKVFNDTPPKN